jgi:predicted nucleic acid-binding protein
MRTAIDSSVLILLYRRQEGWAEWKALLCEASAHGSLVICPIAFAEYANAYDAVGDAMEDLDRLHIQYDAILPEAAYLAGRIFLSYRARGGPRDHLLPDFLIAAHAAVQADRLAALDRGYLRSYFPDLPLLKPQS